MSILFTHQFQLWILSILLNIDKKIRIRFNTQQGQWRSPEPVKL